MLGFPCDQFGRPEPGDEAEIGISARRNTTSPSLFSPKPKSTTNAAHPLFKTLKSAAPGLLGTQAIKWNFTKFLIDKQGRVVRRYAPTDRPQALASDIEPLLA